MNSRRRTVSALTFVALSGTCFTAPAVAHHSAALLYDPSRSVIVEGAVSEFSIGNPHMRIILNVTDTGGGESTWLAEGGSRIVLLRSGWTENELKPGDRITIEGNPSRDNSNKVHILYLTLPDGRRLWGEDAIEPSLLERLRSVDERSGQ